jgi:hypothetical protein
MVGTDPLRPVVWVARLTVAACLVFGGHGAPEIWQTIRIWNMAFGWGQSQGMRAKVAMLLPGVCDLFSLLVVALAALAWLTAGPGARRAAARWRALNIAAALLLFMSIGHVIAWVLYL